MIKHSRRYVYYQPNKKDVGDNYGDCTIRALSKAWDCTWLEAFDRVVGIMREEQVTSVFACDIATRKRILDRLGFDYHGVSNKRGAKRPTVDSFAKDHPEGSFICNIANHEVAVVDGKYYDTWDSGICSLYGYFERRM